LGECLVYGATGHASVNEIKDINDAFSKAPKTVANKVISELSDNELSRLATEVYGKTAGLSASEKTQTMLNSLTFNKRFIRTPTLIRCGIPPLL
jgi:hypothetical protein